MSSQILHHGHFSDRDVLLWYVDGGVFGFDVLLQSTSSSYIGDVNLVPHVGLMKGFAWASRPDRMLGELVLLKDAPTPEQLIFLPYLVAWSVIPSIPSRADCKCLCSSVTLSNQTLVCLSSHVKALVLCKVFVQLVFQLLAVCLGWIHRWCVMQLQPCLPHHVSFVGEVAPYVSRLR